MYTKLANQDAVEAGGEVADGLRWALAGKRVARLAESRDAPGDRRAAARVQRVPDLLRPLGEQLAQPAPN